MLTDYEKQQLEKLKRGCEAKSAIPLLELMYHAAHGSQAERDKLVVDIENIFTRVGEKMLMRAFIEGDIKEAEWKALQADGWTSGNISTILSAYFFKKDHPGQEAAIIEDKDSFQFKHKEWVFKRFKVVLVTAEKALEIVEGKHGPK